MNKRIRELAGQAGAIRIHGVPKDHALVGYENIEKFAELIVRETIKEMATQMDEFGDDQSNNPVWYKSEKAVKKHFGVEE